MSRQRPAHRLARCSVSLKLFCNGIDMLFRILIEFNMKSNFPSDLLYFNPITDGAIFNLTKVLPVPPIFGGF